MNPAPSKYSIYYWYLLNARKNDGIIKGSTKTDKKEGAG